MRMVYLRGRSSSFFSLNDLFPRHTSKLTDRYGNHYYSNSYYSAR